MKKNYILTALLLSTIFFACKKENTPAEPNIISVEDYSTNEATNGFVSRLANGLCCNIPPTNITRDPNFTLLTPSNYNTCNTLKKFTDPGRSLNWFAANYTANEPKVGVLSCFGILAQGACDSGYVSFKGNKTNGQSISQDGLSITMGQVYKLKFNARIRPGSVGVAKVGVRFSNSVPTSDIRGAGAGFSPNSFKSDMITDTAWRCYTIQIQDNSNTYSVLNIAPFNQYTGMLLNYAKIDIDNIKLVP
jgi:hypothetical protein